MPKPLINKNYKYPWVNLTSNKLLDWRICDLGLQISGSPLEVCIQQLYRELEKNGVRFRPHCWLSDDWFCPDGIPGIAIPFYHAHPRLKRLEKQQLFELEGGNKSKCMQLLRHETGHAILNAYQFHRRKTWRDLFGKSSIPYPDRYRPRAYSKHFVIHLDNWYAQSHPHEDWAETFAVWLNPRSYWRNQYQNWPAMKKLVYVDLLMQEINTLKPHIRNHRQETPVSAINTSLHQYYEDKKERLLQDPLKFYDRDLLKLFSKKPVVITKERAAQFLRRTRRELGRLLSEWTAEFHFRIDQLFNTIINRCDELDLYVTKNDDRQKEELTACLSVQIMNHVNKKGFYVSI